MNVKIFYKNFQLVGHSHVGLGCGGMHCQKVLKSLGVRTDLHGIKTHDEINKILASTEDKVTHVLVEAPWVPTSVFSSLCTNYPETQFICRSHSQIAFLQVDPGAFKLIREYTGLEEHSVNFKMAVNNTFIGEFIQEGYHKHCMYLPNLYWSERVANKQWRPHKENVRLGSFGALRIGKNHTTAVASALVFSQMYGHTVEFYLNSGRDEQTGVLNIVKEMTDHVPGFTLKLVPWQPWNEFRHWIEHLDCHIQLSSTESFNITSADAASANVPTVCGPAINWLPDEFKVNIDSPVEVAHKINHLLNDAHAGGKANAALNKYMKHSLNIWKNFLHDNLTRTMPGRFE